jgi:uncharacterized protein YdhG (YjbR/CyaY superfamily)
MNKPASVDAYLDGFGDEARPTLIKLRELMRRAVPEAAEVIKWGHPSYEQGVILFAFAGFAKHANLYCTPTSIDAFAERAPYGAGKGSIRCPYDQPLPVELIDELLAHRLREYDEDGIGWR